METQARGPVLSHFENNAVRNSHYRSDGSIDLGLITENDVGWFHNATISTFGGNFFLTRLAFLKNKLYLVIQCQLSVGIYLTFLFTT